MAAIWADEGCGDGPAVDVCHRLRMDDRIAPQIRFDDGAAYERYMGKWSQLAGGAFLDWLAPAPGLRWLDVGCGNGAFTEMLVERCAPASVRRDRPVRGAAGLRPHTACAACRAVSSRRRHGAAVPRRHVRRGGHAAGDLLRSRPGRRASPKWPAWCARAASSRPTGGTCWTAAFLTRRCRLRCVDWAWPFRLPPSPGASAVDAMRDLWAGAGLDAVETQAITVQRTFADFDDYWTTIHGGPSVGPQLAAMAPESLSLLKARMRALLPPDADWPYHLQCPGQRREGARAGPRLAPATKSAGPAAQQNDDPRRLPRHRGTRRRSVVPGRTRDRKALGACRLGRATRPHTPDAAPNRQRHRGGRRLSSAHRLHRVVGRARSRMGAARSRHRHDVGADGILPPGRGDQRRVAVADRAVVGAHCAACRRLLRLGGTGRVIADTGMTDFGSRLTAGDRQWGGPTAEGVE